MFYLGCPMWGYKGWVQSQKGQSGPYGEAVSLFPPRTPASEFLRLYSQCFNCVEGNTTFYATPSPEMVARWVQETPESFRFCPKIARDISHSQRLEAMRVPTLAFVERMRELGTRLGPMFLQLPPSFAPAQLEQLQRFLDFWPSDVRLAVEVRHADFYTETMLASLDDLLRQHQVARVIMDTRPLQIGSSKEQQVLQARERKPNLPVQVAVTADFVFIRYIGHPRIEVNQPLLEYWAKYLGQWLRQDIDLYVFCHCPYEEYSPALGASLYNLVKTVAPLPALHWPSWSSASPDTQPEQARLF